MATSKKKEEAEVVEPIYVTVDPDESADRVEGITGADPSNAANIYAVEAYGEPEDSAEVEEKVEEKKEEAKTPPAATTLPANK